MPLIELERRVQAPVKIVWEVLTDHRAYVRWAGVDEATLEREGKDDPNGQGALRHLRKGPVHIREEIVASEAPRSFSYTVVSGPPVRDYLASVSLAAEGEATLVRWTVRFEPKVPLTGPLMKPVVRKVITDLLSAATREAERRARSGPAA